MPRSALRTADKRYARLVVAVLLFSTIAILLYPFHMTEQGRLVQALANTGHALLMGIITCLLFRRIPGRNWKRYAAGLVLLIILVEFFQPLTGRSRSLTDVLYGVAGITVGIWIMYSRQIGKGLFFVIIPVILIVTAVLWNPGSILLDSQHMKRQFPVLCDFETRGEFSRWICNGCQLRYAVRDDGTMLGEVTVSGDEEITYPGLFLMELIGDWSRADCLSFDLWVENGNTDSMELRVDDLAENPPYAERFQTTLDLNPGWNNVTIPLSVMRETPSGRLLDFNRINKIGVFMTRMESGAVFRLDNIELKMR